MGLLGGGPSPLQIKIEFGLLHVRRKQLIGLKPEDMRQPLNVIQRDVPGLSLHMTYEGAMEAGFKGQRLLRPPALPS